MLLEALHQQRLGNDVRIVDGADIVGGAWREMSLFGLRRIEIAPHVIMYNRSTYDYFAKDIGLKMTKMTPSPKYVWMNRFGSIWIPYVISPFLAYFTVPLHYIKNPQYRANFRYIREEYFGRLKDGAGLFFKYLFTWPKPAIEYPAGGTLELLDRIEEDVAEAGLDVDFNKKVESIEKVESGELAVDISGERYQFDKVFLTRHQSIPRIAHCGKEFPTGYSPYHYTSVHLLLKTLGLPKASFCLAKGDDIINLVSDLTSYMDDVPEGLRVVTVRFHYGADVKDREGAERIVSRLIELEYFNRGTELQDFHFSSFEQGRMLHDCVTEIEQSFGDSLEIFKSTSFPNSISDRISLWRESAGKSK
ncbi:FAD-dependent oxidoreductase [bacterium]|nr:FAD-dependent oxidoreductase [Akkermansiaceae bacterium]MDA7514567.1 FAD-dependent oxidoreductase [bacterium]MDA7672697.1 FAD-dependent oxidoreductase [Akkermansiaceae bacterium]MDB4289310.1 FAD-dependent oxidoreductase [bacterium]MDB4296590.1 FAD-dependent oxidoreductase [Akkermansiaceae bacterium]